MHPQRRTVADKGGVSRMNSRRGVNLSRIQRQGNAISCAGLHSQHPSSDMTTFEAARCYVGELRMCRPIRHIPGRLKSKTFA